jgi:hypothetical protein
VPVVAASWAETEHWESVSAGESQHALIICHFLAHACLACLVMLGSDHFEINGRKANYQQ